MKYDAVINDLRESARLLGEAVKRLGAQDSFHQEHTHHIIQKVMDDLSRCDRKVLRLIEERHEKLHKGD